MTDNTQTFAQLKTLSNIHVLWHVTPHRTVLTDVAEVSYSVHDATYRVSLATESCYTVRWLGSVFSMKLCSCEWWMPQLTKHEQLHYIWVAQVVLAGINVHRTMQITSL
jgi:demethoxyubiquinone hydroxylase (CLK1/Coq7/Cat5 family)